MTEKRIRTIEANCGEHIAHYVNRLLEEKKRLTEHPVVNGEFNGVLFGVTEFSTEEALLSFFDAEMTRKRKEYEESAEYKQRQRERIEQLNVLSVKTSMLMDELRILDFSDYKNVLKWVKKFQPYSNDSGLAVPKEEILHLFATNGYEINVNTYAQFNSDDEENHARWIIGQALDGIEKVGAMHPMVVTFTERWENKFLQVQ